MTMYQALYAAALIAALIAIFRLGVLNGRLRDELDRERMRLAACGVAALGYFNGCAKAYESASLSDVLRLRKRFDDMREATISHVDGRDLLYELKPNGAHLINIHVRINGQWKVYEGDWLKKLMWARDGNRLGGLMLADVTTGEAHAGLGRVGSGLSGAGEAAKKP